MAEYNLKQNLSRLKNKPFNFILIEGRKSDMVLVTPRPAAGKMVEETKNECGDGKRVTKGVCLKEAGQIVFATRSAPLPAWKSSLKKILQAQRCAMFLPIELRQLSANESEEMITEETGEIVSPETDAPAETAVEAISEQFVSGNASTPPANKPPKPPKSDAERAAENQKHKVEEYVASKGFKKEAWVSYWLEKVLAKPHEPPEVRDRLYTALNFFKKTMPDLAWDKKMGFLQAIDFNHVEVEHLEAKEGEGLQIGSELIAYRDRGEDPVRLYYTEVGTSPTRVGIDSTGRKFFRFKVIALADMLRCRTSGVVAYKTGAMVSGGGMQYIIPNAQKCLEKMY
jgi:hypothetical protein